MVRNLRCPCCGGELEHRGGSLVCSAGHTYDIAKSGYVNMVNTSSGKQSGDSKEMVTARTAFLNTGAYARFRDAVCSAAGEGGVCIDAGCGEGYYTEALAAQYDMTYGFDLSKTAVNAAAKRARASGVSERCFFGVGSVYSLPVCCGCADTVVNIFAPCVEEEYLRVLRPGGSLIVACAGREHLHGLKAQLYEDIRDNTKRADLPQSMEFTRCVNVRYDICVHTPAMIAALYSMTPYSYRTGIEAQKRLLSLDTLETAVDFDIYIYRKK